MHLQDRHIAMLDVIGLSGQIADRSGLLNTIKKYNEVILESKNDVLITKSTLAREHDARHCDVAEFVFDTLVLVSKTRTERANGSSFISCVSGLMGHFAANGLPLRGAIAIGDYVREESTGIFLSDVFRKMDHAIKCQQWSGCYLLPEYAEQILRDAFGEQKPPSDSTAGLFWYEVPVKCSSAAQRRWCLNWLDIMTDSSIATLLGFLQGPKHVNTKKFIDFFKSLPQVFYPLPPEFAPARTAHRTQFGGSSRISFRDESGNFVRPGCAHFACNPAHLPEARAFIGYGNDQERAALEAERWH